MTGIEILSAGLVLLAVCSVSVLFFYMADH